MESVPAVIIGAGVVGCALAQRMTAGGDAPLVLEAGPRIVEGVTSRNSGVIHAGLYYPPASLKAASCLRGGRLLYEWCSAHSVPHGRTGKWVVATDESQVADLHWLVKNAAEAGAAPLRWESAPAISGVKAIAAVHSPETGIVDPYAFSRSLQADAEEKGAAFIMGAEVLDIQPEAGGGARLETNRGVIKAEKLFVAAGLQTDELLRKGGIACPQVHPWRGDYFSIRRKGPWPPLVYPVKNKNAPGLGVHLTMDLGGRYRLGPDVSHAQSRADFSAPDAATMAVKAAAFFQSASRFLEGLCEDDLTYDSCGIRPKLRGPGETEEKDFHLAAPLPGIVVLAGIESPGLTASLDLAERALKLL